MVGMILLIFLVLIESNLCEKYETITEGVFNDHNEHRRAWIVPEFYLNDELNQDSIDYAEIKSYMKMSTWKKKRVLWTIWIILIPKKQI
ncbi:uncharacterized protein LOC108100438 isoform X2 [Drosophila ficusphila]|uniref:uncharacterized protein LOC108100438 isoform X2 n=1 Tax=Drosophila ficusphila TaxID=30025 RepID=UPI001C8ABF72|nr:uncharacterized protein LOC108100438 isoform X2 [Drosophila ficusphila]